MQVPERERIGNEAAEVERVPATSIAVMEESKIPIGIACDYVQLYNPLPVKTGRYHARAKMTERYAITTEQCLC